MIELKCNHCDEKFKGDRPSTVFSDRRIHMEQRHLEAPVESDTSGRG